MFMQLDSVGPASSSGQNRWRGAVRRRRGQMLISMLENSNAILSTREMSAYQASEIGERKICQSFWTNLGWDNVCFFVDKDF